MEKLIEKGKGRGNVASKKRRDIQHKSNLSKTQEVLYSREFKMADRAGGYTDRKNS